LKSPPNPTPLIASGYPPVPPARSTSMKSLPLLSQHLLHFLRDLIDPGIPIPLDEVEDPAHDRPARHAAAEDQAAQRNQAGHRIYPLPQQEVLDCNRSATDPGDHGADHPDRPFPMRAWRRHQHHHDGREQRSTCRYPSRGLERRRPGNATTRRFWYVESPMQKGPPKACASGGLVVKRAVFVARRRSIRCPVSREPRWCAVSQRTARFP
jgi:hypothetical protein